MKLRMAFFFLLCSIAIHFYLTLHYYDLALGIGVGEGMCNISSTFSCDAASASSFATLLNIPIAAWGVGANLILLIFVFMGMARLAEDSQRLSAFSLLLATVIAAASVIMGTISSFILKTYCPFCMGTYVLSFLTWFLIYVSRETDDRSITQHFSSLFKDGKSYFYAFIAFIFFAYAADWGASKQFRTVVSAQFVSDAIADWQAARPIEVDTAPVLTRGPAAKDAQLRIFEFADFLCPHCKFASKSFKVFLQTRPDIHFGFFSFPLDGNCNTEMTPGNGVRCYLAKLAYCAETESKKGWEAHDLIFNEQENLAHRNSVSDAKEYLNPKLSEIGIQSAVLQSCLDSDGTSKIIKAQAELGHRAGIRGTPSFLVNGKILSNAQFSQVMEKVYEMVKSGN